MQRRSLFVARLQGPRGFSSSRGPTALGFLRTSPVRDLVFSVTRDGPVNGRHEVSSSQSATHLKRNVLLAALTGWGSLEDPAPHTAAGIQSHLVKPLEPGPWESAVRFGRVVDHRMRNKVLQKAQFCSPAVCLAVVLPDVDTIPLPFSSSLRTELRQTMLRGASPNRSSRCHFRLVTVNSRH